MTLPYKKDKNSINSASFIEQLKGAQVHANDLPHSLEVPAADTPEDHRALPEVLEEEGHRVRAWSQLQHGIPYSEGSNFYENNQRKDERKLSK